MPFTAEEHKAYRVWLKIQNICTRCHRNDTDEGRITCSECVEITVKDKREARKDKTRCYNCLNKLGEFDIYSGRTECPRCVELKRNGRLRRKYETETLS